MYPRLRNSRSYYIIVTLVYEMCVLSSLTKLEELLYNYNNFGVEDARIIRHLIMYISSLF